MSARLATAIAEAAARAPGLTMRRGTVLTPTTVGVHDGTVLSVVSWVGTPTVGGPCLLLALRGSYVGLPLGPQAPAGGGGVTDHGALTGLADPDHPIAAVVGLQSALDGKSATGHTHTPAAVGAEPAGAVSAHAASAGHEVLSTTIPAALGSAAVGVGTTTARSDHVHAMPTATQVGAEPLGAVAAVMGSSTLSAAAGWAEYGGDYSPSCVTRMGDLIVVEAVLKPTGSSTWTSGATKTIATVPPGYQPVRVASSVAIVVLAALPYQYHSCEITKAGAVTVTNGGTSPISLTTTSAVLISAAYRRAP